MDKGTWDDIVKNGAYVSELDWFALDNKGQLGVFTATMNAPVPAEVKKSFDRYKKIKDFVDKLEKTTSSSLTTKEKGNFKYWIDYADKGIFSFDFQDIHRTTKMNHYDLIARPGRPIIITELGFSTDNFVKLDCEFDKGDLPIERVK